MGFMGGSEGLRTAYEAPFPDQRYKAAAQIMPYLVPSQLRENEAAWGVFEHWDKPFLVAFTDSDPITRGGERVFLSRVPSPRNVTIRGAGHFVQEGRGGPSLPPSWSTSCKEGSCPTRSTSAPRTTGRSTGTMAPRMTAIETRVLIVGAGPVGLITGLLLDRLGVDFLIVERRPGLHQAPQAHVISSRTLEICRTVGIDPHDDPRRRSRARGHPHRPLGRPPGGARSRRVHDG